MSDSSSLAGIPAGIGFLYGCYAGWAYGAEGFGNAIAHAAGNAGGGTFGLCAAVANWIQNLGPHTVILPIIAFVLKWTVGLAMAIAVGVGGAVGGFVGSAAWNIFH